MKRCVPILVALWAVIHTAQAHDFWITPDGGTLHLHSGHYFPNSEGAPNLRNVARWAVQSPDGSWREWSTDAGHPWSVPLTDSGTYRALVVLQAPRARQPMYFAQSLWVVQARKIDWPKPIGAGLEIHATGDDNGIMWRVLLDGAPTRATLLIQSDTGATQRLISSADAPAQWQGEPGRSSLLTATVGAQTASLLIHWPEVSP